MLSLTTNDPVMFHQISWQTYLTAFAVVAVIYYALVLSLFFKKDIIKAIHKKIRRNSLQNMGTSEGAQEKRNSWDDYTTYQSLRDEITALLDSVEPAMVKPDILFRLASIIKKHPSLEDERFREALGKEIRRLYVQKYKDGITEDELASFWEA